MTLLLLFLCSVIGAQLHAKEGYHHFPEIFIGATYANSETEFTYAFEYEYKFDNKLGAGLIYEKIAEAHHGDGITIQIAAMYYHPTDAIRIGIGLGQEKIGGHHPHTEKLMRVSASYEYHFTHFSVAPTISVDFIDDENALVFGVGFIKPF